MEVHISESAIVVPSNPPFAHDHTLNLSHLDTDRNLNVTFRYLRVYTNTTSSSAAASSSPFDIISTALSTALISYYPLAASLRFRHSDNRLELFCTAGQGVPIIRATANCTLESVNHLDDSDSNFVEQLVPDPNQDDSLINPCQLQITVFECGGFTLGTAIHHALCDGLGATNFFNAMAELARGAARISVEPVWNRADFLGPRNPPRIEAPIHEFLSLDKEFQPYKQAIGPIVKQCFHVKDECLDRLKTLLFEKSGLNFTTFEALGALIWRAKVKASKIPGNKKVKFAYSINVRKQVKPPLPAGYWGNGCVPMYVQMNANDLTEKPIWETAQLIKKSKSNANYDYLCSFIDFQELHYGDGITAGEGVSGFTDWRHLGHSTVDFGWGGPVTVFPLSRHILGSVEPCFFLPYSTANVGAKDGFKVLVSLQEATMPDFRTEMDKFSTQEFDLS